ncbi:hypothetical protein [Streptomyces telluris]|uniref:Uncharacterized protein n=1 Tax=Streptomyces telluris TaxID=2720021 RepID=A0A9X2LJZ4_9ACTN|nr:hypothetical protein [Streptomyces telluris]MCQ8772684.1 hypothetical protein [Streptomyces telluris]NJP76668.1 hypothetical protein [Streptomyces telluris]
MDDKGESEAKQKGKRLELSLAQVAGSALAAVVAALLAGKLGVYGTVIGAGVVSVVATSGGTVFQHVFKRTGEQLREATTQAAKPKLRQVPVRDAGRAVGRAAAGDEATRPLHTASRSPESGGAYAGAHPGARADEHSFAYTDTYTPATTHGTRVRGWKGPLIAAGAVFVLAMGTVTAVELVKGSSADGGKGTTFSRIIDGGKPQEKQDPAPERSPDPERSHDGGEERGTGGGSGPSPDPDASRQGGGTGKQSPDPSTSPSSGGSTPSTKPDPTPDPSASQGGGTGGDDKGGGSTGGQGGSGGGASPKPPTQGQNAAAGTGAATPGTVS